MFTTLYFFRNLQMDPISQSVVLHYSGLEMIVMEKHSSLFGPFVRYEDI
jgi:hypothetical protein